MEQDRVIFHCDLNSFFASVELLERPDLRGVPAAVCGDPASRHGIILAKNEPAKAFGVKTAETIWQAQRKCPDLVLLPSHHEKYRAYSKKVNAIYHEYTDLVEPFGIDESWLDVTSTLHLYSGDAPALADSIRARIRRELGLTISVGVSFNKVFAKLGSDYKKPDATTVITRENFRTLVWPLPVSDLLFVGKAAEQTLARYGIRTIGELAAADRNVLFSLLGRQGPVLHDYACGLDRSPVSPEAASAPPKSVGNGLTFPRNLLGRDEISAGITRLSGEVAARLRKHHMKCGGVSLTIRDPEFHDVSRQMHLEAPSCVTRDISHAALSLADRLWDYRKPVRALTVTAISLIPEEEAGAQLDLFSAEADAKREQLEKLESTLDDIRARFGKNAILPASLAGTGLQEGSPHDGGQDPATES